MTQPRATSVTIEGDPDGFEPTTAWWPDHDTEFGTRLVISVSDADRARVHVALAQGLGERIGVLYRRHVDRLNPRPNGVPPEDFVGLDIPRERLFSLLESAGDVVYADARAEFWLRGQLGEQLIMDQDGMIFCYPDDVSFRDALTAQGVLQGEVQTISDRDYVKHWFHAPNDAAEQALIDELGLVPMASRG